MKKELNIENIVDCLNQQDEFTLNYSNPNIKNYYKYTNNIIRYFTDDIEEEYFDDLVFSMMGSTCELNEDFCDVEVYGGNVINFTNLYPNIVVKLWEQKKIRFTNYTHGLIYKFLVRNKKEISTNTKITPSGRSVLNLVINYLYAASIKTKDRILCIDYPDLIISKQTEISNYVIKNNDFIYIDVDKIFFKDKITNELILYLDSIDLPYEITDNVNFLFFRKKTYIKELNGDVSLRGLDKRHSSWKRYSNQHDIFVKNINLYNREKKIKRLLKNVNRQKCGNMG